ncbi:MAG: 3-isopropylmalate dehydratase small subunit [Pseudomonadota bacterium]
MTPIRRVEGRACPLGLDNVDTDQLCPARFMKRRRAEGYGDAFLHALRVGEDGTPQQNSIDRHAGAVILLAGRNFGAGSSREAAVYATLDAGFRVVVASSFGDIFAANAARNGLLPARVEAELVTLILEETRSDPSRTVHVDLETLTLQAGDITAEFHVEPSRREMLLNGWDDLDVTAQHADAIARFQAEDARRRPWAQRVEEPRK